MPDPVTLADAAAKLRANVEARGIAIPDQIDWDELDAQTRADWEATRVAIRMSAWSAQVPEEFASARLEDLDPAVEARLRTWFVAGHTANVVLAGGIGTGKTHAAYAIGHNAINLGIAPFAVTSVELLDAFRPAGDDKTKQWILGSGILIIDDLGVEKDSAWTDEAWHSVIDHRYKHQLPIVVTTNATYEDLDAKYGRRVVSRLVDGKSLVVRLDGVDRRKEKFNTG